jgi:nucleotide-binding universal stress UspA family protein
MKEALEEYHIRKILVPVDFSETSNQAVRQALLIAKTANAAITLLHVVPTVFLPSDAPEQEQDSIVRSITKSTDGGLQKMVSRIKAAETIPVKAAVLKGNVTDTICDMANSEDFDLIVMGTHGTSGIQEFFAGSTAYRVVRHSACPVLTLRHSTTFNPRAIVLPIRLERSSRQKVDYVVELARLFGSIVLITGYTDEKSESKQEKIKQYVRQVENYLSKLDIKFKSKLIFAPHFVKEILKYAEKSKAGLVVTMKEHDFSLDQMIQGSYTEQLVNHSGLPVLTIPVLSNPDLLEYEPYLSGVAPF